MPAPIHFAKMPHERGEGAGVGLAVGVAEGGEGVQTFTLLVLDEWKARLAAKQPKPE